jgi:hypothetical protein
MKPLTVKLSFLATLIFLTACTKTTGSLTQNNSTSSSNETLTSDMPNKWDLISDSAIEGVGLGNHPVDYTGEAGDYFSFGTNGYVYTKEGNALDTLTYEMVSGSAIIISEFGLIINTVPDTCTITGLTGNLTSGPTGQTIVIESPLFLTPGGEFWRKVTLSR